MIYKFKIDNGRLAEECYSDAFSGNKNVYLCEFDITCDENDAVWFSVFKKNEEIYIVPISEGKCSIPYEVLENSGTVYIGCYAECAGEKRISTNWMPFVVKEGAYSEGTAPQTPDEELWEVLLRNSVPVIGENGNWFTYDMAEEGYIDTGFCAKGEQGQKGDKGEKGDTGAAGYTPQKGVDYLTQAELSEIREEMLSLLCPKTETTSTTISDAIKHNVIDYTIYGNSGGVGDAVTEGEHAGEYKIVIEVQGKNIFDKNDVAVDLGLKEDGTTETSPNYNDLYTSGYMRIKSGTPYTINNRKSSDGAVFFSRVCWYDANKNFIQHQYFTSDTITSPNNARYMRIGSTQRHQTINVDEYFNNLQIEEGAIFTAYEQHRVQIYNIYISSPLTENESTSLEDTNTQILLHSSINRIFFDTAVQPSSVNFRYYQDINKVIPDLKALISNQ